MEQTDKSGGGGGGGPGVGAQLFFFVECFEMFFLWATLCGRPPRWLCVEFS